MAIFFQYQRMYFWILYNEMKDNISNKFYMDIFELLYKKAAVKTTANLKEKWPILKSLFYIPVFFSPCTYNLQWKICYMLYY